MSCNLWWRCCQILLVSWYQGDKCWRIETACPTYRRGGRGAPQHCLCLAPSRSRVTLALSLAHSELQCALVENASDESVCLLGLLWGFQETKARQLCLTAGLQGALHTHQICCLHFWNLLLIFKIFLALPAYFSLYANFRFVLPAPSPPLAHPSPPNKSYQNFGWKSGEPIHEFGKI